MSRFSDYNGLCTAISDELARSDILTAIKDKIWLAECDIQNNIRMRMRDGFWQSQTTSNEQYITFPDDYAEGGFLRWTSDLTLPPIEIVSYAKMDQIQKDPTLSLDTTRVRVGTVHGNRLYIGPVPGVVEFDLFYKAGVQHLGAAVKTNYLLANYPDTVFYGALHHLASYTGDDGKIQTWGPFYERAYNTCEKAEWRGRTGDGILRMRPDVQVV